jgi:hypothetical protein
MSSHRPKIAIRWALDPDFDIWRWPSQHEVRPATNFKLAVPSHRPDFVL